MRAEDRCSINAEPTSNYSRPRPQSSSSIVLILFVFTSSSCVPALVFLYRVIGSTISVQLLSSILWNGNAALALFSTPLHKWNRSTYIRVYWIVVVPWFYMSLSSHPFPFGNRLEIPLGFATPEAQSTCRWSRGSAAVSLSGSATPASLRTLLCQEKKLCKPVPGSQLGLDPGHNQLQSQSLPQSLHTIIYNIMPFHTYEQHGTATCKHLMLHGSWKHWSTLLLAIKLQTPEKQCR